jgi:hypothetical protein
MILAVVAEVMAALYELLYAVGVIVYPAARHKKSNLHIVLIQDIHNLWEILCTPRRDALVVFLINFGIMVSSMLLKTSVQ